MGLPAPQWLSCTVWPHTAHSTSSILSAAACHLSQLLVNSEKSCVQAAGSSYTITEADVEEGEVDETVKSLLTGVTTEGYTDHFHGKGQKAFADNYLELWERVRHAYAWLCFLA